MHPDDITYPKNAKKATWDAAKTLADKTKKTGLADKLKTAETAWAAIAFTSLDAKQAKTTDLPTAKAAQAKAKAAMANVDKARLAVTAARTLAKQQSTNTALSSDARKAAAAANTALDALVLRFAKFGLQDFDERVTYYQSADYAKSSGQLTKLEIGDVGIATAGVWDRKTLKATRVTWTKPYALNKKYTIKARQAHDDHAEERFGSTSGQALFKADLTLVKATTNTAEFKS